MNLRPAQAKEQKPDQEKEKTKRGRKIGWLAGVGCGVTEW